MARVPEAPARRPDPRRAPSEDTEQSHLMHWARLTHCVDNQGVQVPISEFLIFIPNGGNLSKAQRGRFKAMGLKSGVSDLLLCLPKHGYAGLWIELKSMRGTATQGQRNWQDLMRRQGFAASIAYGWREAADLIVGYLEGRHG